MSRRVRWILLVVVVAVAAGAAALVVVQKPKLDDALAAVDARWKPLRAPDALVLRYQKLEGALSAFDAAGGTGRTVSRDLHAALDAWKSALREGDDHAQTTAANSLEGQGARLGTNVLASDRFRGTKALTDAIAAFAATRPPQPLVNAYNAAALHYERVRTGTWERPVARILGDDARPRLELSS